MFSYINPAIKSKMAFNKIFSKDMEMIKFVVTCLKTYYPSLIDYMIIYQMPFVFNAAWKVIRNWLPAQAVNLIKFTDKINIKEYIQESQLFVHMGGTVCYL